MKKVQNWIYVAILGTLFIALTVAVWFAPDRDFSDSERRKLAQYPELSVATVWNGSFMKNFESYTQDQFPLRDGFRSLKAMTAYYFLGQMDNNGIYIQDGYAAKLEYPLNEESVNHAADRFQYLYDTYLKGKNTSIYLSVVPDKGYYLAEENGILHLDYDRLFSLIQEKMPYASYLDITHTLELSDYYKTDTHWCQECLVDTANALAVGMGSGGISGPYRQETLERPFYGVYYGQAALPMSPDCLNYLTNDVLDQCRVTNWETGTVGGLYDMDKVDGKDLYELFLSGSVSLITIENPVAQTDRELVIFRDSFGSSLAPLLTECYRKITLVDIRYLRPEYVGNYLEFENQDVLFLYSTLVLNHSETLI